MALNQLELTADDVTAVVGRMRKILPTTIADDELTEFSKIGASVVNETFIDTDFTNEDMFVTLAVWLSAHFLASTRERQLVRGEAKGVSAVYQGKSGMRFESTLYGQNALAADVTGKLKELSRETSTRYYAYALTGP